MEAFLDIVWHHIVVAVQYAKNFLDIVISPLNALGPAVAIATIALITVVITKFLSKNLRPGVTKNCENSSNTGSVSAGRPKNVKTPPRQNYLQKT